MFPQLGAVTAADEPYLQLVQSPILATFTPKETSEWRRGLAQSEAEGTLFIATPYHCAVGTKPE